MASEAETTWSVFGTLPEDSDDDEYGLSLFISYRGTPGTEAEKSQLKRASRFAEIALGWAEFQKSTLNDNPNQDYSHDGIKKLVKVIAHDTFFSAPDPPTMRLIDDKHCTLPPLKSVNIEGHQAWRYEQGSEEGNTQGSTEAELGTQTTPVS
ncbi:hypothetical protein M231_01589 [Tremella mesenterica]|uniref:Uncharacterized protein n=1 Tax=Tremella mesenterica TaxID=5217 RepID=A0A4Q1BT01_TREME|nr:hypothetical protein M231_01589 [Tremella mesenterica]